jgi:peptide/nickel transport system substrate-binding protein
MTAWNSGRMALAGALAFSIAPAAAETFRCGATGGALVFGQEAQVPTLDMQFSSSIASRNAAMHFYEMLITRGENKEVIPQIADSWEISDDQLTYTFKLRDDITFHNGKPLTSADVLASFERYQRIGIDKGLFEPVALMSAPDDYTVVLTLDRPIPVFLEELSSFRNPPVIIPAEQKDAEPGKIDIIGTGPYRLVEWVPDSHIEMARFEDYSPDTHFEQASGFGGYKQACFDTVTFRIVKEPGARVAGLETGELDVVEDVPTKTAERLRENPEIVLHPLQRWWLQMAIPNLSEPPTDQLAVRKAIQVALDMEEIMEVATDGAYDLQPGHQYPGDPYYTEAGGEWFNVHDPERAKQYLEEAGYAGEEIVFSTNTDYTNMYNAALVMADQLKAIGMNIRLDVSDWPTSVSKYTSGEGYNFFFTGNGTGPSIGPRGATGMLIPPANAIHAQQEDPELMAAWKDMNEAPTLEERKEAFARMQARIYDQAYLLKLGDLTKMQAARAEVQGFKPYRAPRFWNVWIEE